MRAADAETLTLGEHLTEVLFRGTLPAPVRCEAPMRRPPWVSFLLKRPAFSEENWEWK